MTKSYPDRLPGLTLGIANTVQEYKECLTIVYQAYLAKGYCQENPQGFRCIPPQLHPASYILYAKLHGEIIGTATIVTNEAGMQWPPYCPAETDNCAEVCALAIKKGYRRQDGYNILFPLMKLIFIVCKTLNIRYLYNLVRPKDRIIYQEILGYQKVPSDDIGLYGVKSILMRVDLSDAISALKKLYGWQRHCLPHYIADSSDADMFIINTDKPVDLTQHISANQVS